MITAGGFLTQSRIAPWPPRGQEREVPENEGGKKEYRHRSWAWGERGRELSGAWCSIIHTRICNGPDEIRKDGDVRQKRKVGELLRMYDHDRTLVILVAVTARKCVCII